MQNKNREQEDQKRAKLYVPKHRYWSLYIEVGI